jgi:hypothetical protein
MATYFWLITVWALITIGYLAMVIYRSRLTRQETDWIPLTDDAREERAIEEQTVIELKAEKLKLPIRALATASLVMLLVILAFWFYQGISTPPPMPQ